MSGEEEKAPVVEDAHTAEENPAATVAKPAAKPAAAKPAAKEAGSEGSKSLVVKNAVGEYIRAKGLKVSSDLYEDDGLNGTLKTILDAACERCKDNSRKTVMKHDL